MKKAFIDRLGKMDRLENKVRIAFEAFLDSSNVAHPLNKISCDYETAILDEETKFGLPKNQLLCHTNLIQFGISLKSLS